MENIIFHGANVSVIFYIWEVKCDSDAFVSFFECHSVNLIFIVGTPSNVSIWDLLFSHYRGEKSISGKIEYRLGMIRIFMVSIYLALFLNHKNDSYIEYARTNRSEACRHETKKKIITKDIRLDFYAASHSFNPFPFVKEKRTHQGVASYVVIWFILCIADANDAIPVP